MRSTAPGGGDPPGFRLDDCSTQRNLSDDGREEARRIGAAFRTRGIPVFGPHAGELEPLGGPDLLAAALETCALALLAWELRRVARPGWTLATLLTCVAPGAAAMLALVVCTSPAGAGEHDGATGGPAGHATQGLPLSAGAGRETVTPGGRCPPGAPVREYRVAAINVEITLNRFLDYDPKGRMYVLEAELARVRQEEVRNREARAGKGDPAASHGLQGDAIQPLTIRVNQGECLRVALRNALDNNEPASFHLHGAALYVTATGAPALAANPDATVSPGAAVIHEWWVAEDEPEGTHYFHSHGHTRLQTAHGLFGAVIVAAEVTGTAQQPAPVAQAVRVTERITVDGRLDEPVWERAQPATDFIQWEPNPGMLSSEKTEVRFVYNEDNLYIGIAAYDSEPQRVIGTVMARDASLNSDDRIEILLDTFHMNIEEPSIEESIRACGERIFHFHVADSNRWHPGAGHLDFGRILTTLFETGYTGFFSGEFMPKPDADTGARRAIEYLRSLRVSNT